MGYWHELDREGKPTGPRHAIYDRDPEKLYYKILEKESPPKRTLRDVAEEWEAVHREAVTPRTWANYAPHLEDILGIYGGLPVASITAADISQDLQAAKVRGYSHTVVNSRRSIWRGVLDYALGCRDIPYNPALSVQNPKGLKKGRRSAPEEEMLREILRGADSVDFPFVPFFLLCTGLRRSEALRCRSEDLDLTRWELRVPRSKTAAGVRTVPIIEPLREPLKRWMAAHPGEWLFPYVPYNGRTGTHMSDSNWERAWLEFCRERGWIDEAGNASIGAHHLRHSTATLLYEAGVDAYTAQHILGHASLSTTMEIYTDLRRSHELREVRKLGKSVNKMLSKTQKSR